MVAPVDAPGKIVYWALADDMGTKVGSLKGFGIGEEGVRDVLVPSQVASRTSTETCVGCHTATPDGDGVGFSMGPTNYFGNLADIRRAAPGVLPSYANPTAMSMIRTLRGIPAYSKGALERRRSHRAAERHRHAELGAGRRHRARARWRAPATPTRRPSRR